MDIPDNESFCVYPWIHQNIDSRGEVTLCCRSKTVLGHAKDLDTLWNGPEMLTVRQRMLDGKKVPHCTTCYHHESIGKVSNRQFANTEWYPESMWGPNLEESITNGLVVSKRPSRIDLKFGNLCNLTCRMCSGRYSSQINKDVAALRKLDPATADEFGVHPVGGEFNWYDDPRFWEIIDQYIPDLLQLDITGGEPTLVEQNMVMLQRCIDLGYAQQIKLSLNTNLTNLKPDFLAAIVKFKKVTINASIDGIGLVQEYIRYPSKWSVIKRNLITLLQMSHDHNIKVNISSVTQIYNVFQTGEFIETIRQLYEEYGNPAQEMKHQFSHVMWPTYLSLENAPEPVKRDIIAMSQQWLDDHPEPFYEDRLYRNCFQTFINQCQSTGDKPISATDLLRFTRFHDQNKKTDLETSIPELYHKLVAAAAEEPGA